MKRYLTYLACAVATFILGVVISPIRFWMEAVSCGRQSSSSSYRSSYFLTVRTSGMEYPSIEKAGEEFQSELLAAVEIIERTPELDKDGHQVGERAIIFYINDSHQNEYAVLSTNGKNFYSIRSSSLMHVLQFEKRFSGA